jgi:uncharacterized protein (TIGR03435 family)
MVSCLFVPKCVALAKQPERPSFEVDSVKAGDPIDPRRGVGFGSNGRFRATNASLRMLLVFAYEVQNQQISRGPNWMNSERFTIEAKSSSATPEGPAGVSTMRLMLQSLLADRFKLVTHRSIREENVYELIVKSGGSSLKEAGANDGRIGLRIEPGGEIVGAASPISLLVNYLSQQLQCIVVDKTNLTGKYDFVLKLTANPGTTGVSPPLGVAIPPISDSSGRSIFTALQDDLGLKLHPAKGPVEVLVIDHVQKPDPN